MCERLRQRLRRHALRNSLKHAEGASLRHCRNVRHSDISPSGHLFAVLSRKLIGRQLPGTRVKRAPRQRLLSLQAARLSALSCAVGKHVQRLLHASLGLFQLIKNQRQIGMSGRHSFQAVIGRPPRSQFPAALHGLRPHGAQRFHGRRFALRGFPHEVKAATALISEGQQGGRERYADSEGNTGRMPGIHANGCFPLLKRPRLRIHGRSGIVARRLHLHAVRRNADGPGRQNKHASPLEPSVRIGGRELMLHRRIQQEVDQPSIAGLLLDAVQGQPVI